MIVPCMRLICLHSGNLSGAFWTINRRIFRYQSEPASTGQWIYVFWNIPGNFPERWNIRTYYGAPNESASAKGRPNPSTCDGNNAARALARSLIRSWSGTLLHSITYFCRLSARSIKSTVFSFSQPRRPMSNNFGLSGPNFVTKRCHTCKSIIWFLRGSIVRNKHKIRRC